MAPPFSMSRLWHHVSIPADVDGFVIPSPTWLPRFVHVILSLIISRGPPSSLFILSLSSLPSLPVFPRFLFFSSLPLSSPLFIARGRNRFSLSHDLSLFFSSYLLSLSLSFSSSLSSSPARLSLSRDGNFRREEIFLFLSSSLLSLTLSFSSLPARLSLSLSLDMIKWNSSPLRE